MRRSKLFALTSIIVILTAGYAFTLFADEEQSDAFKDQELTVVSTNEEKAETTTAEEVKEEEEKKDEENGNYPVQGVVQGDALRLRQWPWGPVMGKFYTGDSVTVLGEDGEFYKVEINGMTGYMHKNYVSIPGAEASRAVPYYPGDTESGGYLSREEGTNASKNPGSSSGGTGNYNWSTTSGGEESEGLKNYKGGKLSPNEFISLFGPVAQDSMKATGVPASVTLAQAILETGWGKSTIGDAKNLFGIKGVGPAGTIDTKTREVYNGQSVTITDGFRKYNNWQESIDDHARLVSSGRYKNAWNQFQSDHNADAFARGIHQAGYATEPNYANYLINLMKQYNLYQWDI